MEVLTPEPSGPKTSPYGVISLVRPHVWRGVWRGHGLYMPPRATTPHHVGPNTWGAGMAPHAL